MKWHNVLRVISVLALAVIGVAYYGFDALANPVHPNIIYGLIALSLNVDVKELKEVILRMMGGGRDEK